MPDHFNIYGNDLVGKLQASNNQRYYYLKDHLGSIRVTLDQSGNVDSWTDHYPFGKEARGSNTVNEPREGFTGHQHDGEMGLEYMGARYYNSNIARFLSVDPLNQFATPYVYVGNNPIALIDPTGMAAADYNGFNWANAQNDFRLARSGNERQKRQKTNEESNDGGGEGDGNGSDGLLAKTMGAIRDMVVGNFKKSSKHPRFNVPPATGVIYHGFGSKRLHKEKGHKGTDIINEEGTPIVATAPGKVIFIDNWTNRNTRDTEPIDLNSMGMMVRIDHGDGEWTEYGHLQSVLVKETDFVQRGDVIGLMGNTGASTNPHLHFMYKVYGVPYDPNIFVPALIQMEKGNVHFP